MMSEISFPLSLTNLFLAYAVWFGEIRDGKIFFNLSANVLEINLESSQVFVVVIKVLNVTLKIFNFFFKGLSFFI